MSYNGGDYDAFAAKLSPSGAHLWSTYLGGTSFDYGEGIAVDGSGNIVVTGSTRSIGWVSGGFDTTYNGWYEDGFVAKLSPQGAHLWSTYLGGSDWDWGYGIAVDTSGNIVVTGFTESIGWIAGGFDTTYNGGRDAFVAKLSPLGAHLWSTYLGGTSFDYGEGIAVDGSGNIVVTGNTGSSGWVSGGFDTTHNGNYDAFVAKLSPSGAHLWSTYLGGTDRDWGYGIAVDASGNIVVTGETYSIGWVSGGFDTTFNGSRDAFVAKVSPQGAHLWSSYLGGGDREDGYGIAVDGSGNIVVTGGTWSSGWVSGGFDTTYNGFYDAFVAKLSPEGAHLWSSYLGGSDYDYGLGIAVDGPDNIVVTGMTTSTGWVSGGFDTTYNGDRDAFVVKIRDYIQPSPTATPTVTPTHTPSPTPSPTPTHTPSGIEWSTYLGGNDGDGSSSVAVDGSGNIVVTGWTKSSGWIRGGFDTTYNGGFYDAFVAKLSASGARLWSTYLGGNDKDYGDGIAIDGSGNMVVTGETRSSGWVSGGFDTTHNGSSDAFVAKLSPSGAHLWSTYLGGSDFEDGYGIAVDPSGNIAVTGTTGSSGWVSGGFDTTYNGGTYDGFVAKLSQSGAHLWSTYLGGSDWDESHSIAAEGSGNIVVTGFTGSIGWVSGGFDTTLDGGGDAFVAKLSPSGAHLWSSYLGGSGYDRGFGITLDGSGNIVVTGKTDSSGWISGGFDTTHNGNDDAFVAKLSASGAHVWSTYLGGSDLDWGHSIAVYGSGSIMVTGRTCSSGWVSGGFDTTYNGGYEDGFVAKLSPQGAHLWSAFLGGSSDDYGSGIAVDGSDNIVMTGWTYSSGWVSGGYDPFYSGGWDGFVAKIRDYVGPIPTPTATPTPSPTPWRIVSDFVSDEEGWTTGGAATVFTLPDFAWEPDFLTMTSRTNTNTFGFWRSPQDAVPADPDYLYRARFNVSTDLTAKWLVPQIRLSANSLNLQQYDILSIESAGDGGASPSPSGTNYDLYFVPPANDIAAMLAFDLLNFNPDDAAVAEFSLDTVTVDRFALDSLAPPTLVQDYTFELSADGWTTGGAPIFFSAPQYIHAAGALELRALTNTNTFGYWVNTPADITIEADKLYRGTFEVRTDVTNPALVPEMRLRFNAGNFQASSTLGIVSSGNGANSPGTTNTTYDRLYFLPPVSCDGQSLIVSFDILNFDPEDATTASLILDRAIIETLSVPASP